MFIDFAWFSRVYLRIHAVHKSNCKYLDVHPKINICIYIIISFVNNIHIYIYTIYFKKLYTKLYVYITMNKNHL